MREPEKILAVRFSSIGDVLLTTPLLRVLRKHLPKSRIDFVVRERFAPLLWQNPRVFRLVILPEPARLSELQAVVEAVRAERYDIVLDLHRNWRSFWLGLRAGAPVERYRKDILKRTALVWLHWNLFRQVVPIRTRYFRAVARWGLADDGEPLEFYLTEEERGHAEGLLRGLGVAPGQIVVGLAIGAGFETKRWPAEHFAALTHSLREEMGAFAVLLGDSKDRAVARHVLSLAATGTADLTGRLSLRRSAAILERCDAVVSNDSGLMHLAQAVGRPLVAIFGSTTRELGFYPQGPAVSVLERKELRCRPCSHTGRRRCPRGHLKCLRDIRPESVKKALEELIGK